jgi:uncharacterized membrane protein YagU involved in acid resistance
MKGILVGGLIAGCLDISDACVWWRYRGVALTRGLQGIASGLLGKEAFSGGTATAALGLAFHFLIAFSAAVAYYFLVKLMPALAKHPVPSGIAYGLVVLAFMNLVVLPLSHIGLSHYKMPALVNQLFAHTILVGLPIALAAHRFAGGRDA